ncbi:DUF6191 domain-containing protein [Streptomyces sp. NBC_01429]|nr:DUF6191 domain-containing protein [Streptomyces sp. NBC_01429]
MFNMFEEIFAPGRKHTHDEQKRLELSRVDVDPNDPGRGPIDLTSGKVTIRVPEESVAEESVAEESGAEHPDAGHSGAEESGAGTEAGAEPESGGGAGRKTSRG